MILASGVDRSQSFEVASVRLSKNSQGKGDIEFLPGGERFAATNVPLGALILIVYNLTNPQCFCENSAFPVLSERFDIQAKAEKPVSASEMLRLLQNLLQERFKLALRRETKELEAYALFVDKGGPKLHLSDVPHIVNDAAPLNPYHARGAETRSGFLVFKDEAMSDFAFRLSTQAPPADASPSIFTALREQLGLRLESRKIPLEFLSIEHAERPAGN
jgi:uncharacterized protein (TIGR03435 family)